MNHPTREELTLHLLGEAPADVRRRVAEHLETCPGCQSQVTSWRGTMHRLDTWRLRPPGTGAVRLPSPIWRWAIAASIVLSVGFALGRSFAPMNSEGLRQALSAELRKDIQTSIQQFAATVENGRAEDLRAVRALLIELEERRVADYAALQQDLETVATFTDEEIREARRRLTMLSQITRPLTEDLQQ